MTEAVKKKNRRWFRFSLASIFLLMLLVAGLLALWQSLIRPTQMQWNAIRHLVDRGVRVETTPSQTADWVKQYLPVGETENVNALFFRDGGCLQPGDLACLQRLPHLKRLYLERCDVSDEDVKQIGKHQPLERLAVWGNKRLSNACVEHLGQLENLNMLDIHTTGINWRAAAEFKKRPDLKVDWDRTYLRWFEANSDEIDSLANYFPEQVRLLKLTNDATGSIAYAVRKFKNLTSIGLDDAPRLSTAEINSLAESSKELIISIADCTNADDAFFSSISECFLPTHFVLKDDQNASLQIRHRTDPYFRLYLRKLSPQLVKRFSNHSIFADVPECEFKNSDEETVYQFAKQFKQAKYLRFIRCSFTSFDAWKGCPKLKKASFIDCGKLESINALSNFESLQSLWISNAQRLVSIKLGQLDEPNPNLSLLHLGSLPSFRSFSSLSRLKSLEKISVEKCNLIQDVSWISGMAKLREFTLGGCALRQVTNLQNLPSLEKLEFKFCDSINQFADCQFDPITKLIVTDTAAGYDDFGLFQNVSGLLYLQLDTNLETCKNVEQLDSLKDLQIHGLIKSINGLERLPNLEVLDLGYCSVLNDDLDRTLAKLAQTLKFFNSQRSDVNQKFMEHLRRFRKTQDAKEVMK